MTNQACTTDDDAFRALYAEACPERRPILLLLAHCVVRDDLKLAEAVLAFGSTPFPAGKEGLEGFDVPLIERLGRVCKGGAVDERAAWGRLLLDVLERGNRDRLAALEDLVRRRIGS